MQKKEEEERKREPCVNQERSKYIGIQIIDSTIYLQKIKIKKQNVNSKMLYSWTE